MKIKPTIIIPPLTIPIKMAIICHFKTFLRIIISGNDSAITDIINARAVPKLTPFSIRTLTIGITPAALEYNGTPIKIARGTPYQFSLPSIELK